MRKGKIAAQCSHASMMFLVDKIKNNEEITDVQKKWLDNDFTKICVGVDSEEDLIEIYENSIKNKVEVHIVTDVGKTEFKGIPTKTCLAIGPDYANIIDPICKHLKLL